MKSFASFALIAGLAIAAPVLSMSGAMAGERPHKAEHSKLCPTLGGAQSGPAVYCQGAQAAPEQMSFEPGITNLTDHAGARRDSAPTRDEHQGIRG